jgi:hypothetical protein
MIERWSSVMAKAWARADEWNALHPVGTKVRVSGETVQTYETVTSGVAYVFGDGRTVVPIQRGPVYVARIDQLELI